MEETFTDKAEYGRRPKDFTFRGMPPWVREMYRISQRNANRRNIPFDLSRQEFREIVLRSENRCMVSGIPFEFTRAMGKRRPFAPSLDRINNTKGYSASNCRLVCVVVNLAMNEWGLDCLMRMARNIVARQDELAAKEKEIRRFKAAQFLTIKQFCSENQLDLSQRARVALSCSASRLCKRQGVDTIYVPIGERLDGRPTFAGVRGFPEAVLKKAFSQISAMQ